MKRGCDFDIFPPATTNKKILHFRILCYQIVYYLYYTDSGQENQVYFIYNLWFAFHFGQVVIVILVVVKGPQFIRSVLLLNVFCLILSVTFANCQNGYFITCFNKENVIINLFYYLKVGSLVIWYLFSVVHSWGCVEVHVGFYLCCPSFITLLYFILASKLNINYNSHLPSVICIGRFWSFGVRVGSPCLFSVVRFQTIVVPGV